MKVKLSIVMLVLLSFLNMGASSIRQINGDSFNNFEYICMDKSELVENGVKLQYKTMTSLNYEKSRIESYFKQDSIEDNNKLNECNLNFYNDDYKTNVKLWNDSNYTYVVIILINTNEQYRILDLKSIVKKIENNQLEDIQYFLFYKGKVNYTNKAEFTSVLGEIMSEAKVKDVDILSINNGYTGTGYLNDSEKVNFSIMRYNTGSYIVIGTPVLITSY